MARSEIIRVLDDEDAVEQIDVTIEPDGYHVTINRTLWTRNRRRRAQDQRGEIIKTETLLRLSAQDAAALVTDMTWTLIHVDSRGPKEDA